MKTTLIVEFDSTSLELSPGTPPTPEQHHQFVDTLVQHIHNYGAELVRVMVPMPYQALTVLADEIKATKGHMDVLQAQLDSNAVLMKDLANLTNKISGG